MTKSPPDDARPPSSSNDPLLARLRAADPISPPTLPSADDSAAQRILEQAMTTSSTTRDTTAGQPSFGPPPVQSPGQTSSGLSRRWGQLAAVAAAVLVLVMGVVVLFPSNSEPALAAVQGAAQTTADVSSGRATTTFTATAAEGGLSEQAGGVATLTFVDRDLSYTVEFNDLPDLDVDPSTNPLDFGLEGRLVDDVLYAQFDGQWVAIEAPELLTDMALDIADPRTILLTVQELLETEEIGSRTIDGVDVTHYQSLIDLGDETVGQAGWLGGLENQLDLDADGEVTIDLYVDSEGLMYRIDVIGDLAETTGTGTASFEISTVFTDLGADLTVEAPEGVEILDLGDFGLDKEDFGTDEEN